MKPLLSALICAAAFGLAGCVSTDPDKVAADPVQNPPKTQASAASASFAQGLAAARASSGAGAMTRNTQLDVASARHARDMEKRGYFDHNTPEGVKFDQRIRAAGYCLASTAENIAEGVYTEEQALKLWLESAPHRKNMLNPKYTQYGLGHSGKYWVMDLAGPCVKG